jgi:hypothetical protein
MPGPAPKPADQRARRNPTFAMTALPAAGRPGRAPKWPLGADVQLDTQIALTKLEVKDLDNEVEWCTIARDRAALRRKRDRVLKKLRELEAMRTAASRLEKEIWAALWKTPQATQWEKRQWFREVALYARHQAKAEAGSLDDSKEARAREDRLGLNDMAMLRLRWEIVDQSAAATGPTRRATKSQSRYGKLKVVGS